MSKNRKALCVGVNIFKNYPSATLQGCVNDAHEMAALLKDLLGFSEADISILTDRQATKINIMKNLQRMVTGAKAGKYSYLVFSFSSRGSFAPKPAAISLTGPRRRLWLGSHPSGRPVRSGSHHYRRRASRSVCSAPQNVLLEVVRHLCSGTGIKSIDLLLDRKTEIPAAAFLRGFHESGRAPVTGVA